MVSGPILTARGLQVPLMTQPHCRFPGAHLLYFSPHSQFSVLRPAAQGLFPVCLASAAPGAAQCLLGTSVLLLL